MCATSPAASPRPEPQQQVPAGEQQLVAELELLRRGPASRRPVVGLTGRILGHAPERRVGAVNAGARRDEGRAVRRSSDASFAVRVRRRRAGLPRPRHRAPRALPRRP